MPGKGQESDVYKRQEQFRREMMQMIYRYLNKQDVLITRIFDGKEFDEHYEKSVATLPDMEMFIKYIFEKLAGFQHQDNRQESVVEQMKQYINENLKEDLSRKTLAKAVYLSEDYVSKIFTNVDVYKRQGQMIIILPGSMKDMV